MAGAGAVQGHLDRTLAWYSQALAGKETWHGFARALDNDPEMISDAVRWYARREIPDDGRATREEREAARDYYARLPEPMRQAFYVKGAKGEAAPGVDDRVIRMLAAWAKESAPEAARAAGSAADRFAAAAEAEIAHLQPGAAKPSLSPADEAELERHRRDMAAPRGSPEARRYWGGGEKRYRELVSRQRK